jgi:hypothetical protein
VRSAGVSDERKSIAETQRIRKSAGWKKNEEGEKKI